MEVGWTSCGEATGDSNVASSSSPPAGLNMHTSAAPGPAGDDGMDNVVDDVDECVGVVGLLKGRVISAATDAGEDEDARSA